MEMILLVIGISGITGGGKTLLATSLLEYLGRPENGDIFDGFHINIVKLLHMDAYFYPRDSPHHVWLPEINYINRELMSAMDVERFVATAEQLVTELNCSAPSNDYRAARDNGTVPLNILIVEGFFLYRCERVKDLCTMRLHIDLSYAVGLERRLARTFKHVNPQPCWYYEHIIWPSYQQYFREIRDIPGLIVVNGEQLKETVFQQTMSHIKNRTKEMSMYKANN